MTPQPQVMVVDDDLAMRDFLRAFLTERGCQAVTLGSAEDAIKRYQTERPAVIVLDVQMPGAMDGLRALAAFKKIDRDVPVIILSGDGRSTTVVQAMELGAADFVSKPFDLIDLEMPLAAALKRRQLSREVASLRQQLQSQGRYGFQCGRSERMAEVRDLLDRAADIDVTVLVRGESGTGKELVARALYWGSSRHDKPFVKVNCAALPAELLESELVGFERGAFTGAIQPKPGKFEFANGGTMFLDEIGDMSPAPQAKLLQVLQDGGFSRLGGKQDVRVDVRIIAATNRPLERAVADGLFREDLFFCLNRISITLPALRDRREEIPLLSEYFLKKYAVHCNKVPGLLSDEIMRLFMEHDWPGNVRELEHAIRRVAVRGEEAAVRRDLLGAIEAHRVAAGHASSGPESHGPTAAPPVSRSAAMAASEPGNYSLKDISRTAARKAERELILKTLTQTRWNRKATAEILGISYKALLYKIKENGLERASEHHDD